MAQRGEWRAATTLALVYVGGADVTGDGRVARRNARVDVCMGRTESGWEREGTPRWRVHDKERSGACNARHKHDTNAPSKARSG